MIKEYLPSKKFAVVLGAILLISGGVFYFKHYGNPFNKIAEYKSAQSKDLKLEELAVKDTDTDGVPDWEEALWGTDPKNPDTKGDGLGDKKYIDGRRSALSQGGGSMEDKKLNDTDIFARDFFTAILSLRQEGNLNSGSISSLSETVLKNAAVKTVLPDTFTVSNLSFYKDDSKTNLKKYHTEISKILTKYKDSLGGELETMGIVIDTEGREGLDDLKSAGLGYESMARALMKIKIPPSATALHLELSNDALNTSIAISNMSKLYDNPLLGLIGIGQQNIYSPKMIQTLENLATYFAKSGIIGS